jgi:hypothetical protein
LGDSHDESSDDLTDVDVPALRPSRAGHSGRLAPSEDDSLSQQGHSTDDDSADDIHSDQTAEDALPDDMSHDDVSASGSENRAERPNDTGTALDSGVSLLLIPHRFVFEPSACAAMFHATPLLMTAAQRTARWVQAQQAHWHCIT